MRGLNRVAVCAALASLAMTGLAGPAVAQQGQRLPDNFKYELKGNERIPKGNTVTNPDGSTRKVIPQGRCATIKEKSADGSQVRTWSECQPK